MMESSMVDEATGQSLGPGTVLNGRYTIERELARGGFGVVYLATDNEVFSRRVVVKVLQDAAQADPYVLRKFYQEMEALARIDHPGVIGVFGHDTTPDGRPFFVTQFIGGITLRSALRPEGMDFERIAKILRQIAEALSAAHEVQVFHRDLKPENIMLQETGDGYEKVKLIDFGLAKVENSRVAASTALPTVAGSYGYMSPEQLMAKPAGALSDIYSLAAVTYEMVTGRRPFNPDSAFELLEMQRKGVKVRPSDLRPALPDQAERAILKSLSFHPDKRHASIREFCADIVSSLENLTPPPFPLRHKEEAGRGFSESKWMRSSWVVPALALINGILGAFVIKLSFFRFDSYFSFVALPLILLPALLIFFTRNIHKKTALFFHIPMFVIFPAMLLTTPDLLSIDFPAGQPAADRRHTLNYSDPRGFRYTVVNSRYCRIQVNPGRWNTLDDYDLEIRLTPELEFADVYFDSRFGLKDQLSLVPSSTDDILLIRKAADVFHAPRNVMITYKYRYPNPNSKIAVTLKAGLKTFYTYENVPIRQQP